jgi:hypothetical protein
LILRPRVSAESPLSDRSTEYLAVQTHQVEIKGFRPAPLFSKGTKTKTLFTCAAVVSFQRYLWRFTQIESLYHKTIVGGHAKQAQWIGRPREHSNTLQYGVVCLRHSQSNKTHTEQAWVLISREMRHICSALILSPPSKIPTNNSLGQPLILILLVPLT